MEVNQLLMWVVGANSLLLLLRSRAAGRWTGWGGISGLLLVLLAFSLVWFPQQAGYVVGIPWAIFIFIPIMSTHVLSWLVLRHWYRLAWIVSQWIAWLHPFDGCWQQPQLILALRMLYEGDNERARLLLQGTQSAASSMAILAQVFAARLDGNWSQVLMWLKSRHALDARMEPLLIDTYLQALGETGQHTVLLHEFERLVSSNQHLADGLWANILRMRTAAYFGEVELVERLLSGPVARLAPETRTFWRATAWQTAGQSELAGELLTVLMLGRDRQLAERARLRLERPLLPPMMECRDQQRHVFQTLEATLGHESRFAVMGSSSPRPVPVTWLLVLSLLAVFCLELPGGATDYENLYQLGALVLPTSLTPGEYDRYVIAAFLHWGPLHLLMNVFGLQWFGQKLERAWGSLLMLACYLLTAIGSLVLFPWMVTQFTSFDLNGDVVVLVGASGGVMGLVGGLLGHLLVGYFLGKSAQVTRELGVLILIVVMQVVFDINAPEVSGTVHLTGAAGGFLFGVCIALVSWSTSKNRTPAAAISPVEC